MHILKIILNICLLRAGAQDLPASMVLLWLAAAAGVAVNSLGMTGEDLGLASVLFIVSQAVLYGAAIWLVLQLRGFPARWLQTMTALYAVEVVFSLMLLPLSSAVVEMLKQGPQATLGWEGFAAFALIGWLLLIIARVLREATEWPLALAFLTGLTALLAVRMLGLLLVPLFGLSAPA
jgi:hypothetical protein